MQIELYINGEFMYQWIRDDIREDYTELGIIRYKERMHRVISNLKEDICVHLQNFGYEFYVVYQSNLNSLNFTELDMVRINKEINVKRIDKIAKKYKKSS